jgi:hypothetical protein
MSMILSLNLYKFPDINPYPATNPYWMPPDAYTPSGLRELQQLLKKIVPGDYVFLACNNDSIWVMVHEPFEIIQLMEYT